MDWIQQFIDELEKEKVGAEEQVALLGKMLFTRSMTMGADWVDTTDANKQYYQDLIERLEVQIDRLKARLDDS